MRKIQKTKRQTIAIFSLLVILSWFSLASASSLSLSLGSYDSEIYTQETVNIPVTITASNITGSTDVTLTPQSGLSCSTCTLSYTFTGASSEQGTVTFTLTGTQAGTYNPPFTSISAVSGSTTATPLSSGSSVTVVEASTWTTSLEASDTTPSSGQEVTLTLTINPSGTFEGVSADLSLTGGFALVSGSDPRTIGTISGQSTYQWTVSGTSSGTASVAVTATNPTKSAADNTETVTLTLAGSGNLADSGGGGGGASTAAGKTYAITREQFQKGHTRQLQINERMKFQLKNNDTHYVTLQAFTRTSATVKIESEPQTATLNVGDEKKFELDGDSIYDLSVRLESVDYERNATNLTVKEISEAVPAQAQEDAAPAPSTETPTTPQTAPSAPAESQEKSYAILIAIVIIAIVIIAVIILLMITLRGKKASKKRQINF